MLHVLMIELLLQGRFLAKYVDVQILNLFGGENGVGAASLYDDAASHLEEHRALESLVKVLATYDLAMIGEKDRIVLLHCLYDCLC